jgi:hypothetical protein
MKHRSAHSDTSRQRALSIAFAGLLLVGLLAWSTPSSRADSQARAYLPAILQQLITYTQVPTSHAIATATTTATVTPSATATTTASMTVTPSATPTMTPTGTPVASCNNKYPITIDVNLLDNNSFIPPTDPDELPYFGLYSDTTYTNKTQRRIYLAAANTAGFRFARWRADTPPDNVAALAASLSGTGNIAQGFDEAPWPVGTPGKPIGYPLRPASLGANDGDWIYGSTASISSDVLTALEAHVSNKTLLTFPVNDQIAGSGSNLSYHVATLGDFLLRGYGNQAGKGWYLDLVYIGYSSAPQCE